MNAVEIIVLIVVCLAFVAAVAGIIIGKIRHKGGCCDCGKSGGCAGCSHCAAVPVKKDTPRKQ